LNNHFYLDISIPSFSLDTKPILDALYNRHNKANETIFGFIRDKVTISIDSDFEIE
jgi:hypothetical protein